MKRSTTKASWAVLASAKEVMLAVDSEYEEEGTLTVQYAVRVGEQIRVQIYHSRDIPPPPVGCFGKRFTGRFNDKILVLPPKPLSADLTPARVLSDILGLVDAKPLTRYEGDARVRASSGRQGHRPGKEPDRPERIDITLVGHFLRVDLLRAFGRNFLDGLLAPQDQLPAVAIREGRTIGFAGLVGEADRYGDPVVEYVDTDEGLYALRLGTFDTNYACGPTSLDELAKTYVGIGKDESVTGKDKSQMKQVFRNTERVADAYRYAATDAVVTLLVAERMDQQHVDLYAGFSIPRDDIPPLHGTPGLRVANLLLHHVRHTVAAGSRTLGSVGSGPAKVRPIKDLAHRGSADALSDGRVSRYGLQTGDTHGGLLQSRTPYQFFHSAEGQFRDVDLKSCYPAIISKMNLYFGRPIVLEPGNDAWSLKQAIEYLNTHAAGDDACFVKVSGLIQGFDNTLIPSTIDALTAENYRGNGRNRAARKASRAVLNRKRKALGREAVNDRKYTALFTDEVNAGVVTWATWLMICALPPAARRQYENLRAETIVFYPKKLVAASGEEFDELVEKYRKKGHLVDWRQELDLDAMTQTTVDDIDETYVSLRYPAGELIDTLVDLREAPGKDTAAGLLYKTLANTVYGVFASPFLPTSNPVAANVITGTARALAFALTQSLNALLVITDGVLYRRDRVPADTFHDRLKAKSEYPLLHSSGGPFVDPDDIPETDAAFTDWNVMHTLKFFGVEGRAEYESLFRLHALSHKTLPGGGVAFDGVIVDGSANYGKLVSAKGGWTVADMKARGFAKAQKMDLAKLLSRVYEQDKFERLIEAVPSGRLLNLADALAQARRAITAESPRVQLPLAGMFPSLTTYKLIKPSAFVFRTARQRDRILTHWKRLNEKTSCGPELFALRRTFKRSVAAVARKLYDTIRAGELGLKGLNVERLWSADSVGLQFGKKVQKQRDNQQEQFRKRLAVAGEAEWPTGLVLNLASANRVAEASNAVSG